MIENVIKMALEERRNDIALSYFLKLSGEEITLGGRYLFLIRGFDEWLDSAVNGNDVGLNPIVPLTSVKESIQNRPVDVKCIRTDSTENALVKVVSNVIGPESMEKTSGKEIMENIAIEKGFRGVPKRRKKGLLGELIKSEAGNGKNLSDLDWSMNLTDSAKVRPSTFEELVSVKETSKQSTLALVRPSTFEELIAVKETPKQSTRTLVRPSAFEELVAVKETPKQIIHLTQLEHFQAAKKESNNPISTPNYKIDIKTLNSLCISLLTSENPILHLKQICNHSLKIGSISLFTQSLLHLIDLFKAGHSDAYVVKVLDGIPKEYLYGDLLRPVSQRNSVNAAAQSDFVNAVAQRYISVNGIGKGLRLIGSLNEGIDAKRIVEGNMGLNRGVYIGLIHYYTNVKTLSFQEADRYYREMISLGYKPNISVLTKLLISMSKNKIPSLEDTFTFYLDEFSRCKIQMDLKVYNSLLKVCIVMGDLTKSEKIIEKMKDTKLDLDTCSVLIKLYTKLKTFDKIPKVLKTVGELEPALNPYIHYSVEIDESEQISRVKGKNRMVLNKIFKTIIQKLLVTDDLESVLYYLKVMKRFNMQIDNMIYSTVISRLPLENSIEDSFVVKSVDELLGCLIDQTNPIVYGKKELSVGLRKSPTENIDSRTSPKENNTPKNDIQIDLTEAQNKTNTNEIDPDQLQTYTEIISIISNDKLKNLNLETHLTFYTNWIKKLQNHTIDYNQKLYIITKVNEILPSKNPKIRILKYLFDIRSLINSKTTGLFYDRFFNINFCHVLNSFDTHTNDFIDMYTFKQMLLENFKVRDGFSVDILLLQTFFEKYREEEYLEIVRGWLVGNPDLKTVRLHLRWVGNPLGLKNLDKVLEKLVARGNLDLPVKKLLMKERSYIAKAILL